VTFGIAIRGTRRQLDRDENRRASYRLPGHGTVRYPVRET